MSSRTFLVIVSLVLAAGPLAGQEYSHQQWAQQLRSSDPVARAVALSNIRRIPLAQRGEVVREALTFTVHEGNEARAAARSDGLAFSDAYDAELYLEAVVELARDTDPSVIPTLKGAFGTGLAVVVGMARFGDRAAPAVLEVAGSKEGSASEVADALVSLRFMAEGASGLPLSSEARRTAVTLTRDLLGEPQYFTVLWRAIELAGVLRDEDLLDALKAISQDPLRFVLPAEDGDRIVPGTIRVLNDALEGNPPLPRWPGPGR